MSKIKDETQYGEQEAKERFRAALQGARIAGHKPMESLIRKKAKKQSKAKKKSAQK
jgi:hypothetical protein